MMAIIIGIHVVVCFLLICIILVQSGRGGGLVESFSGMESVFGTKTSSFMTKLTSVLSVMFFLSCLALALLSVQQSRSLMSRAKPAPAAAGKTAADVKMEPVPEVTLAAAVAPAQDQPVPAAPDTAAAPEADNGGKQTTP